MDVKFSFGQNWGRPVFALGPSVLTVVMTEVFPVPGCLKKINIFGLTMKKYLVATSVKNTCFLLLNYMNSEFV
jgi:hypothetical protein